MFPNAARALSHIHDCNAVHADFRSAKILLDKDLEVKVVGSVIIPCVKFTVTSDYNCYTDPVCNITKSVTHKSDVYSFGVVLIDMFCELYAKSLHMKKITAARGIHHSDLDDNIRKQMHSEAFTILSETINKCVNGEREERPDMAEIVKQLEKSLFLQWKHDKPMLQKIGLDEIKTATNNFDETYLIGSGGFGMVYKAELNLFDAKFFLGTEGKIKKETSKKPNLSYKQFVPGTEGKFKKEISEKPNIFDAKFFFGTDWKIKKEISKKPNNAYKQFFEEGNQMKIPKKYKTTAIKRILVDEKGHGRKGFFLEIEMLRRCEHPNIVSLLGYCNEQSELILVYEFVPKGSLDDFLESTKKETYLTWVQRIKLCLDIAHGLDYLHTNMTDKEIIIHRDIKSANILLGNNWEAKIADFGLSKFYSANQLRSTIVTNNIAGTEVYLDPEYSRTGHLKKQSDIYSFGVVLFEILSGTLAYEKIYIDENNKGIAAVARRHFSEGTLMEMVDPEVMEEAEQLCFGLKVGPNQKSLKSFLKIAIQCIAETQGERPTLKDIINELEIALNLQEKRMDILKFSLEEIKFGTQNFSDKNFFRKEKFGKVYRGEVPYDNERKTVVLKVSRKEHNFQRELEILAGHKHENIIDIVGYCNEKDEKIIVY
ncbi:uncharacterized protein [Rutidosis leptorrhynchoides]|uniref:uncharacterized protein n=1 Tax=Rutidosis leptorrhynchoides TaxID=125765 RepID=UPI003A99ACDA